jgi:hypothetical protein
MNEEEVSAKLDTLIETNRDIRQWLRIMAWEDVRTAVEGGLGDDPAAYELYDALDGETSIGDIIQDVPIARRTAFTRLKDWQRVGIVSKVDRGRYEKIASLDALGVTRPRDDSD